MGKSRCPDNQEILLGNQSGNLGCSVANRVFSGMKIEHYMEGGGEGYKMGKSRVRNLLGSPPPFKTG